jgi:hypothetical protein
MTAASRAPLIIEAYLFPPTDVNELAGAAFSFFSFGPAVEVEKAGRALDEEREADQAA